MGAIAKLTGGGEEEDVEGCGSGGGGRERGRGEDVCVVAWVRVGGARAAMFAHRACERRKRSTDDAVAVARGGACETLRVGPEQRGESMHSAMLATEITRPRTLHSFHRSARRVRDDGGHRACSAAVVMASKKGEM